MNAIIIERIARAVAVADLGHPDEWNDLPEHDNNGSPYLFARDDYRRLAEAAIQALIAVFEEDGLEIRVFKIGEFTSPTPEHAPEAADSRAAPEER